MPNHPSIIARNTPTGFAGVYVHNDGHPADRLPLLRALHAGPFRGDTEALAAFLIDAHPAGWSQLGNDPSVTAGWTGHADGFRCYCHSGRAESPWQHTEANTGPETADWIYLLSADGIDVRGSDGNRFTHRGHTPWTAPARPSRAA